MEFCITRSSSWGDDVSPHPQAYQSERARWVTDCRTFKSPAEHDAKLAHRDGPWLSKGRNHTADANGIRREIPRIGANWYIDIPDLETLIDFIKDNEQVVISCDIEPRLEIYDSYRE